MKRSSPRTQDDGKISLFPFLAVLLCMMGSLLVLLIIVSQRAQAAAMEEQAAQAKAAVANVPTAEQVQKLQAHIAALRDAREQLSARMTTDRQALSHLEDHARRLRDEVERMRGEALLIMQSQSKQQKTGADSHAEVKRLERLVEEAKHLLESAAKDGTAKKTSYSVVPYDGTNPTRRRPIYLECRPDAIVIQPEGTMLRESDFDEPLGPDNPLAVAIRAANEYLARHAPDPQSGQPYPLLIVRPSSIRAFYAARAALQSWGDDIGYELVDDEWNLKYVAPDSGLATVLESSVGLARRRLDMQRALAGRGGGGHGDGTGDSAGSHNGDGGSWGGGDGGPSLQKRGAGSGLAGGTAGQPNGMQGRHGNDMPTGAGIAGAGTAGMGTAGAHTTSNQQRGAGNGGGSTMAGGGANGGVPNSSAHGDPSQAVSGGQQEVRLGEAVFRPAGATGASRASRPGEASSANGTAGGSPGGTESVGSPTDMEGAQSLAKTRGKDWALPGASQGSVGVTRPLRIEVGADRIIVDSGNPGAGRQEIRCDGSTEAAVEKFVSTVWEQMRGWGIAGRGMFWRPVLNLHVMPGGQRRAEELKSLLVGSGLDVKIQP